MTTRTESIDLAPTWVGMIEEIVGILAASDDSMDCHDWALNVLNSIGEQLDGLPEEHKLPMVQPAEFFAAKREILDAR